MSGSTDLHDDHFCVILWLQATVICARVVLLDLVHFFLNKEQPELPDNLS